MSDLQNSSQPGSATSGAPKTWDFMETLFVALVAYGAYFLVGGLSLTVIFGMQGVAGSPTELDALAQQGRWQGISVTSGSVAAIAVLWIAIRKAGREFSEYLALNWPNWDEVVLALLITAIVMTAEVVVLGPRGPMGSGASDPTLVVRSTGALFMLLAAF